MERPFSGKRPIGPFAQSDKFRDKMLNKGNEQPLQSGNELLIEVLAPEGESHKDVLDGLIDVCESKHLGDYIYLEHTGEVSGERQQASPGRVVTVGGGYFFVDGMPDPDITVGQLEEYIGNELMASRVNVLEVNIYKV